MIKAKVTERGKEKAGKENGHVEWEGRGVRQREQMTKG